METLTVKELKQEFREAIVEPHARDALLALAVGDLEPSAICSQAPPEPPEPTEPRVPAPPPSPAVRAETTSTHVAISEGGCAGGKSAPSPVLLYALGLLALAGARRSRAPFAP